MCVCVCVCVYLCVSVCLCESVYAFVFVYVSMFVVCRVRNRAACCCGWDDAIAPVRRRRLPVVMVYLKMAETLKEAVTFIEQGHVRVGPEVVTDPAFLVTRSVEDFVTWVDSSKIKAAVAKYNDKLDDFDLLGL